MFKFSIVSTVFNEESRLIESLEDIKKQTVYPDELIITDAGSNDLTVEVIQQWANSVPFKVKVLLWPGCNVAQGRNRAIEEASNDYIISTDFGCRFQKDWFKSLSERFNKPEVMVVGGTYAVLEDEIQTLPAKGNYILSDGYYVKPYPGFIPSSRSIAFHKSVWESAGRYPEWLTLAADDLVFGMKVLKAGYKIEYVEAPYVYWGRHSTLKAYGKEAFRYGLGDGEARVNLRQFVVKVFEAILRYLVFVVIFICVGNLINGNTSILPFVGLLIALPGFRPYCWAIKNWLKYRNSKYGFKSLLYAFILIELSRINYFKGYISGYFSKRPEVVKGAQQLKLFLGN